MDKQDRQDIFYWIRKVLTVNNRSTAAQNPVYPVYPCLNPFPAYAGMTVERQGGGFLTRYPGPPRPPHQ